MNRFEKLSKILTHTKSVTIAFIISAVFSVLYLFSIEHIHFSSSFFNATFLPNWSSLILSQRVPFIWEPVGTLTFMWIEVFISLNLVLVLILAILVFLNFTVALFSYHIQRTCKIRSSQKGLLGILLALFTGFACCAPIFIIALAPVLASFTIFFIQIQPFMIPASIILMVWGLLWSLQRIEKEHIVQIIGE